MFRVHVSEIITSSVKICGPERHRCLPRPQFFSCVMRLRYRRYVIIWQSFIQQNTHPSAVEAGSTRGFLLGTEMSSNTSFARLAPFVMLYKSLNEANIEACTVNLTSAEKHPVRQIY